MTGPVGRKSSPGHPDALESDLELVSGWLRSQPERTNSLCFPAGSDSTAGATAAWLCPERGDSRRYLSIRVLAFPRQLTCVGEGYILQSPLSPSLLPDRSCLHPQSPRFGLYLPPQTPGQRTLFPQTPVLGNVSPLWFPKALVLATSARMNGTYLWDTHVILSGQ